MVAMCGSLQSRAVLPEDNIDQTLVSLAEDMKVLTGNIESDLRRYETQQEEFRNNVGFLSDKCDESGVVLYSQDERYLYGILQSSQGMEDVIARIHAQKKKLDQLEKELTVISSRYTELSNFLETLKKRKLSKEGRKALTTSILLADSLNQKINNCISTLSYDKEIYHNLSEKADQLEAYNVNLLVRLQSFIFMTGNESVPEIIKHFPARWNEFVYDLQWRFLTGQSDSDEWNSMEEKMYDMLDINTYVTLFLAICFFFLTGIKRFCPRWMSGKRFYWSVILWLALSITGLMIIRLVVGFSPETQMILMLESELYILAFLILLSITIRSKGGQIGRAAVSYLPMYFVTYILIEYRQDLVPVSTITFTAPILFLFSLVGQMVIMRINYRKIEKFESHISWVNLIVITACSIIIFFGYTILSTMVFLLWIGILIGLLLIALIKSWLSQRKISKESVMGVTLRLLISPLIYPAIILVSFMWVTHIYNLTPWFSNVMYTPFLNMPDKVGVITVAKILYIFGLGVIVNYLILLVKNLIFRNPDNRQGKVAVWISVCNLFIWLVYVIAVLVILDVNRAGIIAVIGGASVGIGFAMKDTLENLFSGVSLMMGRLRPGDILQYEGERGKVLNIGVITTTMETEDGPIMTMPNRQLFEKNFKNMTRNNRVEVRHITFDISSNNNPKIVRDLILNSLRDVDGVDNTRKHVVIIRNFGSGIMRVELKVWIDSEKYLTAEPAVREAVFESFRVNGIEAASFLQKIDTDASSSIMNNSNPYLY